MENFFIAVGFSQRVNESIPNPALAKIDSFGLKPPGLFISLSRWLKPTTMK
jgi:hypothetical protein